MSKIEIGYRILISNYGYYGSIDRPYVIYGIKNLDLLLQKKKRIEYLLEEFKVSELTCTGSNSGIIDQLEHIIIQAHNKISKVELKCLHPFINLQKLHRMDHEDSIVLPIINRVVTSEILDHVIDLINDDSNDIFPQHLVEEIQDRIPRTIISKILNILRSRKIPSYDIEDDSRLIALGEGRYSFVIQKNLSDKSVKFLKYPYPLLDLDEIKDGKWRKFNLENYFEEENLETLSKMLEKDWLEFRKLLSQGVIPKFLVTGTNGKTSTTRILSHLLRSIRKKTVGITTTTGIFVDGLEPEFGDFTGPWSARNILLKPIDIGVFEVARGGLIREGIIFNNVQSAIITNVASDHIGLRGIDTLEKMLQVKSLVYHSATKSIVLNADDPQLYQLYNKIKKYQFKLKPNVAVWGVSFNRERLSQFDFGLLIEGDQILLMEKSNNLIRWSEIGKLSELSVSDHGIISFMNINAVLALAAVISNDILPTLAFQTLEEFKPDINNLPGRGNLFKKANRWFMLDYGHNPHALKEIKITIENIKIKYKINKVVFLALTAGDRRDEDLEEYAKILSRFPIEEVIFKDMWIDRRGRDEGEVGKFIENIMLNEGFKGKIFQKPEPEKAIIFALSRSNQGDLIYLCAEKSEIMMKLISEYNFES